VRADVNGGLDAEADATAGESVTVVHLAAPAQVADILRAGVRAAPVGPDGAVGVWCQPVLDAYALPESRRRELRRDGHRAVMAVHADLPAGMPVLMTTEDGSPTEVSAGDAVARIAARPDPHRRQLFVPRSITRREIRLVRHAPRIVDAPPLPTRNQQAQRPHPRPGRRRLDPTQRPVAKPQLIASLLVGSIDPSDTDEPSRTGGPTRTDEDH
jgi:hypothetical protein